MRISSNTNFSRFLLTIPLTVGMMLLLVSSSFSQTNSQPVVDAGENVITAPMELIYLVATAVDPDNDDITKWEWQVVSSPTGSSPVLSCSSCQITNFTGDLEGDYTLAAKAYDDYEWSAPDYVTVTVYVNHPPVAVVTANPVSGTAPLTVQFDASQSYDPDNDAVSFQWDFGDMSTVSSEAVPEHTYIYAGTYSASVTAYDPGYSYVVEYIQIEVSFAPPLAVDAGPDQEITLGYLDPSRTLTATASGGTSPYTYSWSCPTWSTPQTGASVTVTPTVPTTYTVTATDANNQTATDDVYVNVLDWRCGNNLNKVTLCHNGHTICVAEAAVQAHLDIGDTPGGCQASKSGRVVPGVFSLAQNYPNPFNPTTTIEFGIPSQGIVRLRVMDLLGREAAVLVNEARPAGAYTVVFNATNHPSGTYVYQLEWDGQMISKRMTMIR